MTAPSNANTSGLVNVGHIVWWKAGGVSYYPEGEAFGVSKSCRVEPLVTAASAQAAIDAEKATKEAAYERIDIEMARADAEKARADRLAQVVVDLKKAFGDPMTRRALGGHNETQQAAILAATEALQQETQP